jgi:hypothetical protein
VLAGDEVALFNGALLAMTALTLQKQFHALTPAQPANGPSITCQILSPYFLVVTCGLRESFC